MGKKTMNAVTEYAEQLKAARYYSGHSQLDVAKKLGYTTSQFVSNWERGVSRPPVPVLHKLGIIYEVNAHELLKGAFKAEAEILKTGLWKEFKEAANEP